MVRRGHWLFVVLPALAGCVQEKERIETTVASGTDLQGEVSEATPQLAAASGSEGCDGPCLGGPFACDETVDVLEPNDESGAAASVPMGTTEGLTLCEGDEDWFRIVVPEGTIVRAGIEFRHASGDIDLVVYDGEGRLLGSRYGAEYPYSYRDQETDTEVYGFYSARGEAEYYLRVVGQGAAHNRYSLSVASYPYVDGSSCTGAGFSFEDCAGLGDGGSGLLPFPFPDPKDPVVGDGYVWETFSNYRFARRELIMLVRDALAKTMRAFPGTKPLSLIDVCQIDGITPGYDVGRPRHPESTHDQGGNIDIAYFQTDGSNNAEIICGDGSQHEDGYCSAAAARRHIVDLERQAYFIAKLFSSERTRVVGVDKILAPQIMETAKALARLPYGHPKRISAAELASFSTRMAYGEGWPYHHHHIHLSMQWWKKRSAAEEYRGMAGALDLGGAASSGEGLSEHYMTWPPRGR